MQDADAADAGAGATPATPATPPDGGAAAASGGDEPASLVNQKLQPKGYISVRTQFNNVCTFYEMYVAICTQSISDINP